MLQRIREDERTCLFGEAHRIAARAASASTRKQCALIFRAFGDWLAGELARPPALEAWLKVHPLPRSVGLLDEQPLFVRLGRHGHEQPLPLSAVAVHRLVRRSCTAAGVPERLAHSHALRAYWATQSLEAGVSVHTVSARVQKKRQGRNPATGEEITIAAKPASVDVRARPLAKAKAALPSVQKHAGDSPPETQRSRSALTPNPDRAAW